MKHAIDDIVAWPDGTFAEYGDVVNGEYDWKSDDYEVIPGNDIGRLKEAGYSDWHVSDRQQHLDPPSKGPTKHGPQGFCFYKGDCN